MATNTTNYGLVKPAYSDTADIADINGNMDKVDAALQGIDSAIAIVATGNTHAAVTTGQYVYVHGHGSLSEGLYTAKNNISANATLSTSNLTAFSGGICNKVKTIESDLDDRIGSGISILQLSVGANSSKTITLSGVCAFMLVFGGYTVRTRAVYIATKTNEQDVQVGITKVFEPANSQITVSNDNGNCKIESAYTSIIRAMVIVFFGKSNLTVS